MVTPLNIRWLDSAIDSIATEAEYLAEVHPKLAKQLVTQVDQQIKQLTTKPHLGNPGRIPGTRELLIDGYLYIASYRVKDNHVEILEILHTA